MTTPTELIDRKPSDPEALDIARQLVDAEIAQREARRAFEDYFRVSLESWQWQESVEFLAGTRGKDARDEHLTQMIAHLIEDATR